MYENYIYNYNVLVFFLFVFFQQKSEKFCRKSQKKKVVKCWQNGLSPARNTFIGVPLQPFVVMEESFGQSLKAS